MKVAVIGSGIVGLATAYELASRGTEVVVIGDREPGAGASTNNAGWVCPSESGPMPGPGLVLQALRWMLRADSPVYVRPSLHPSVLGFLLGMARACNARAHTAGFEALARLGRGTLDDLDRWAADGLTFEMHRVGVLRAYLDVREHRTAAADVPAHRRLGLAVEALAGDDARALVPELSDRVVGAIRLPEERHVRPGEVVAALVGRLGELGVTLTRGPVTSGRAVSAGSLPGGVVLDTATDHISADAAVIAAGAWSDRVARLFGSRLPIRPGKGYSVDFVPAPSTLRMPIMLAEAHCVMTPLEGALRVSGTMELGGFDESVSMTRVRAIRHAPARYLRAWNPDAPSLAPTAGLRPMAPDGLPIIGPLAAAPGVFAATGHAMLGLTLAPRTAALLADVILGGSDPEVLRPFSPRRFGA